VKFTYYCFEHRDQIVKDEAPDKIKEKPVCPKCKDSMYYIVNGGEEVPKYRKVKPYRPKRPSNSPLASFPPPLFRR